MKKIVGRYHILEGIQWLGQNLNKIRDMVDGPEHPSEEGESSIQIDSEDNSITFQGQPYAELNDWILKDVSGLKFVVKPEIFEKSYLTVSLNAEKE